MCNKLLAICVMVANLCFWTECRRVKRVVGGAEVEYGTQPRVVSFQNASTHQHLCGAYILTPDFAITAAHCIRHPADQYELELRNYCLGRPRAQVLEAAVHDLYDKRSGAHDIAVLRISLHLDDVTWLDDDVLPVSFFGISGECSIYGYGTVNPISMESSRTLRAAKVNIVSLDYCTQMLGPIAPTVNDGMMCAVGEGADSCQGDSGSPLICDKEVQAISSYGQSCGVPNLPGVYTSVGGHLQWIRTIMDTR